VAKRDILAFLEAILRVYNEAGRRDNIWKARVKILVHQIGIEEMRRRVEREFAEILKAGTLELPKAELDRIATYFAPPRFDDLPEQTPEFDRAKQTDRAFADGGGTLDRFEIFDPGVDGRLVLQVGPFELDAVVGRRGLQLERDLFAGVQRSPTQAGGFGERVLLLRNGGHSAR